MGQPHRRAFLPAGFRGPAASQMSCDGKCGADRGERAAKFHCSSELGIRLGTGSPIFHIVKPAHWGHYPGKTRYPWASSVFLGFQSSSGFWTHVSNYRLDPKNLFTATDSSDARRQSWGGQGGTDPRDLPPRVLSFFTDLLYLLKSKTSFFLTGTL